MLKGHGIIAPIAMLLCVNSPCAHSQTAADYEALKERVQKLEQQVDSLRKALPEWSKGEPASGNAVGGGDKQPDTTCPIGQYAVGIRWWGAPGATRYCIGCLSGIQVVCRKLNTSVD